MAGSTTQGKSPVFLLLAGLVGLSAGPALSQETVYIGGTGSSVEVNLDVLDQLGTPPTVPQMLQTDIRRGQVASGAPLPLPGEARAAVSRGAPMPPPTRPASSQSRRVVTAGSTATPLAPAPRKPTLPSARSQVSAPAPTTITPRVPAPARVSAPVPNAPKVARAPAPIVAPPAKVAIQAPAPKAPAQAPSKAPETKTTIPDITIPAAPKATTRTAAIVPPPPPAAITTPTVAAPTVTSPSAKTPEPAKRVASASPAPKATSPAPKASSGSAISIAFDTDAKSLPASASGTLGEIAEKMKADTSMRIQLLAYASAGARSEAKARRLSLSRALEVRSYLIGKGVASTRMDVRALGNQASSGSPDRVDLTLVNR
ncbi:OmpA family protein [Nisaea denitrificans]|uniref:OmpA family protein n=1 Tax=Nisaea denitrificans TaxID=390877 RepID=UPI00041BCFFC|nr:OmpA family protein [Nisaea denitrificans]